MLTKSNQVVSNIFEQQPLKEFHVKSHNFYHSTGRILFLLKERVQLRVYQLNGKFEPSTFELLVILIIRHINTSKFAF